MCPLLQEAFPDFMKAYFALRAGMSKGEADGAQRVMHMHEKVTCLIFTINIFQVCACMMATATSCHAGSNRASLVVKQCQQISARMTWCRGAHRLWLTSITCHLHPLQSLENEMVRPLVLKLVSLPLWRALSAGRLQLELHAQPQLAKHWKALAKKEAKVRRGRAGNGSSCHTSGVAAS
jgi:hypothetical protein